MPNLFEILLLFGIGALAGSINVMAGGGSTLTLPLLIFLGLDGATANGTNRVAILVQNIFSILSFHHEKVSNFKKSLIFGLVTLPGAVVGALAAVQVSDAWFQRILALIMIAIIISMIFPGSYKDASQTTAEGNGSWWVYPALFGIGFYGGFIQVGVGFLLMAAFFHLLRMNLVYVNMHKVAVVLTYSIPTLFIFFQSGHVNWPLGLCLAAGNALGAWVSTRFSVRQGDRLIRKVLIVATLLMAIKLLWDAS